MTYDEALSVTELLCNAFPGDRAWNADEVRQYARGIEFMEAEHATRAVLRAQAELQRRPPVKELIVLYRIEKGAQIAKERTVEPHTARSPKALPLWIKRWATARYLYARVGREQDMRRFPEQGDWADPSVPLMPPDEWVAEAKMVDDRAVLAALGS